MALPTTFLDQLHAWRKAQRDLSSRPSDFALDLIQLVDHLVYGQSSMVLLSHPALVAAVREARRAQQRWIRYGTHNELVTLKAAQESLDAVIRATDREVSRERSRLIDEEQQQLFSVGGER